MLNFKNWIMIETPDSILTQQGVKLNWNTGQTFFIFPGNYALYTSEGQYTHDEIILAINWIKSKIEDRKNLHVGGTDWVLSTEDQKSNRLSEIEKDIKAGVYMSSKMTVKLLSHGKLSESVWSMINNATNVSKAPEPGKIVMGGRGVHREIKGFPNILLGRVWKQEKIISFWNLYDYVLKQLNFVLDFVGVFGNPRDFKYNLNLSHYPPKGFEKGDQVLAYNDLMKIAGKS